MASVELGGARQACMLILVFSITGNVAAARLKSGAMAQYTGVSRGVYGGADITREA